MNNYRHIQVTQHDDIFAVRLKRARLEEDEINQLGEEIDALIGQEGCRKLLLSLGPEAPYCLYSVFLARLVCIRNRLQQVGGKLVLCDVSPQAYTTFLASRLNREFTFVPNLEAGLAYFAGVS